MILHRMYKICLQNEFSINDFDTYWPPHQSPFMALSSDVTVNYGVYISNYLAKMKHFVEKYSIRNDFIVG